MYIICMEIAMYALTVIRDVMHLMLNLYRFLPPAICNCILGSKREICSTTAVTTKDLGNELTVCPNKIRDACLRNKQWRLLPVTVRGQLELEKTMEI